MTPMEVLGIGVAVRDVAVRLDAFPETDRKYQARELRETGGGPVPTALVTLARLGRKVAFAGVVGDDAAGSFIEEGLRREAIDVGGVIRREGFASPSSVIVVENGRRTILEYSQYDLPLSLAELEATGVRLEGHGAFLADARLVEIQLEVARRVRASGGLVVLDVGHPREGVDDLLGLTDIAILSHSFPETVHGEDYDAEEFLVRLWERLPEGGPRVAGLTLGEQGCALYTRDDGFVRIPGHQVESVDSTGAGDVFHGAFVHALLNGDSVVESARFANAAAALSCGGMSGRFPLPAEAEIRRFARRPARPGGDRLAGGKEDS
jgi:sulfofructose kinase